MKERSVALWTVRLVCVQKRACLPAYSTLGLHLWGCKGCLNREGKPQAPSPRPWEKHVSGSSNQAAQGTLEGQQ